MLFDENQTEELRQELLDEIYAGAFVGELPAMLAEEDAVRKANPAELREIAKRYGFQ